MLESENKALKEKLEKTPDIEAAKAEVKSHYEDILKEMQDRVDEAEQKATVPKTETKTVPGKTKGK